MNFQFTHPYYLLLLPVAMAWIAGLAWKSDVQISRWRREPARFGPRFPEPTTKIKASPLWDRQTILEFGQEKAAA